MVTRISIIHNEYIDDRGIRMNKEELGVCNNELDVEIKNMINKIMTYGEDKGDRTGTGTRNLFNYQYTIDLRKGFPLSTLKRVPFRLVAEETLWFIKGDTNLKTLLDKNVNIWNDDAYRWYKELGGQLGKEEFLDSVRENGFDLGKIYGYQWTNWNGTGYNQLREVINEIKTNPDSRRLYVTAWNPTDFVEEAVLPCCHHGFGFYVSDKGKVLNMKFTMRSNDIFLGHFFNIVGYALLLELIALECGLEAGELTYDGWVTHIYHNHLEQCEEILRRERRELPKLVINKKDNLEDYTVDDFEIVGYNPHGVVKALVSVGLKEESN